MIVSQLVAKQGICSLIVENPDDLWVLRRLIEPGDSIITKSSRVIKKEDEYSRPDRERVKVTIALLVENVSLDNSVDRLRIRGRITEASDDSISTAGTHSVSISAGYGLTLKKKDWTPLHTHILNSAKQTGRRFLIVTVDRREAGIGLLSGSHLEILSSMESGAGGKGAKEIDIDPFIQKIVGVLRNSWREGDVIIIAGPGNVKLKLANRIGSDPDLKRNCIVVDGFDLAGADGVRGMLKFEGFQKVANDSLLVEVQGVVDELIKRMAKNDDRVAYALPRVKEAADAGAVERCVVSEDVFAHGVNEEDVVTTLNEIEARGGTVYMCDSSLEMGKQVSSFGGIVAILRYSLKRY